MINQSRLSVGSSASFLLIAAGFLPAMSVLAEPAVEEIVVTARKRGEESLQSVSASIQAIGEQSIKKQVLTGFDDYARQVPSLSGLNKGPGQTQIAIRGVLSARVNFGQPQSQSTSGMYINDVPVTSAAFNPDMGLVDINRIEILRGPQGTLYGASAMSGAIRIIPNMPDTERLDGSVGAFVSNTDGGGWNYQTSGTLNVPVGDTLAVRTTLYNLSNSGFIDNVYTGEDGYNSDDSYGGRMIASWKPTESLNVTGMFIHHQLNADGRPDEYGSGDPFISAKTSSDGTLRQIIAGTETAQQFAVTDGLQTVKFLNDTFDDRVNLYSLAADYDLDLFSITAIGSYFDRDNRNVLDDTQRVRTFFGPDHLVTGDPLVAPLVMNTEEKKHTLELRFASNPDSRLQWVLGGYYESLDKSFEIAEPIADWDSFLMTIGALPPGETSATFYGAPTADVLFAGGDDIDGEQRSVFGELTFPLPVLGGEKLFFTAGGRYFEYDQSVDKVASGFITGGSTANTITIKETGFNPKVAMEYRHDDDVLIYASAAEGFRIGGTNEVIPDPSVEPIGPQCASELASLGISGATDTYGSDSLKSYEIGAKTAWMDDRLRVNTALYYIDWEDIQTNVFLNCGFNIKTNEGSQVSQGVELELSASVSQSLRFNMGLSYTDATLNEDSRILAARKGDRAPYVPEWNANVGSEYRVPVNFLESGAEIYLRGDVSYISDSFSEYAVNPGIARLELPESYTGNIYLGVDTGQLNTAVFIKNIWDERIVTAIDIDRQQPATFSRARPRTIGVSFNYSW